MKLLINGEELDVTMDIDEVIQVITKQLQGESCPVEEQPFFASLQFWLLDFNLAANYLKALKDDQQFSNKDLWASTLLILQEKNSELIEPLEQLQTTLLTLQHSKTELELVSILLAKGDDQKAFNTMLTFARNLEKLKRCASFLPPSQQDITDESLRFATELTEHLGGFINAYNGKDFVLAGDIIEYEMAERLQQLNTIQGMIDKERP